MEDNSYKEMLDYVKNKLDQYPDNENYQKLLELLIQKKSEYDMEKLKAEKEIFINKQNICFQFCMQDALFRHQRAISNIGPEDMVFNN
jgi:hypothetical protein